MDALLGMFTSKIQAAAKKEVSFTDKGTSTQEDAEDKSEMETEEEQNISEEDSDSPIGRGRLLCLDGGGIRGLVLVQLLLEVETLAQCPINHLFDWVRRKKYDKLLRNSEEMIFVRWLEHQQVAFLHWASGREKP